MSGSVIKRKHCMFFSSTRSSIALLAALIGVSMAGGQASGRESTVGADADGSLATSSATPDPATQGESAADAAGTETGRTETSATDSSAASDAGAVSASVEQDAAATDANEPAENLPKVESRGAEILAADFGPKERAIADRAEARWQALARRDFSAAYQFTLPSYRQTHSEEQYRQHFGNAANWRVAKVHGIRYTSPTVAQLRIGLTVEIVKTSGEGADKLVMRVDETWLERERSWFLSSQ